MMKAGVNLAPFGRMLGPEVVSVSKRVVASHKAPLCKGGCQPKADWGIVFMHKV